MLETIKSILLNHLNPKEALAAIILLIGISLYLSPKVLKKIIDKLKYLNDTRDRPQPAPTGLLSGLKSFFGRGD